MWDAECQPEQNSEQPQPVTETNWMGVEETIDFYVAYLMGMLDTLVQFNEVLLAADIQTVLKLTLLSLARDIQRALERRHAESQED